MTLTASIERIYNFSAGPAVLPLSVLQQAQEEFLSLPGTGASILEISHRSDTFKQIMHDAKARLISLLSIPDDYEVIFLQGGSRLQFSMVPMNLLRGQAEPATFVLTGSWGKKAIEQAAKEGKTRIAFDAKQTNYDRLPAGDENLCSPAAYVYTTSNETIQGVQFPAEPETGDNPLVCDASSDFLCRPLPIRNYGLLYACAQKNAGPAGLTIVILRKDLLERSQDTLPGYLNYREHIENDSLYNTPPTFGIYIFGLVARWLQEDVGGLAAMHEQNRRKARMLYDVLDEHPDFYQGHAQPSSRSLMNVTFRLPSDELTTEFIRAAASQQLGSLKGHRSVGGIRASIYNAMPVEGVTALRDFMVEFRSRH